MREQRCKVDLDLVGVAGAEFHPLELRLFTVLDKGRDVPILGQVVGDQAQMHLRWPDKEADGLGSRRAARESRRQSHSAQREAAGLDELPAIDLHACGL